MDGLKVRYWPLLTRRIKYSDLAFVDYRQSVLPREFAGIGLRLASGGVLALLNRKGPGADVRLTDGRAYLVILTDIVELTKVQGHLTQARPDLTPRIRVSD